MVNTPTPNNPAPGVAGAPQATPAPQVQAGPAKPATATATATPAPASTPAIQSGTPAPGAQGMVPLAALHEERTKRQQLQDEVNSLKAKMEQLNTTPVQPQQTQQPSQQTYPYTREQINALWDTDPRQAVNAELLSAFTWYDQVNSGLDIAADQLSTKYSDFGTFRSAAINYVRSMPLNQRDPRRLEEAYFLVKGQQFDAIMRQREADLANKFNAPANFQVPTSGAFGPGGGTLAGSITLTPEQLNAATAMGLTPEAYASGLPKGKQ